MDLQLAGKVAVITGGNRGIGRATAEALAREGVSIAIVGRDMSVADEVAAAIAKTSNVGAKAFKADTGDDASVKDMVAAVMGHFGRIDILVNCAAKAAGREKPPGLTQITNDAFWSEMNVKVMGYLRTSREIAPIMMKQGWGRIVHVSGLASRNTGSIIGTMRNVSVAALAKNMADELAGTGVNVVCVHPGLTRTEKTPDVIAAQAQAAGITPAEQEKRMDSRNTIRKLVTAQQVADVITFVASPRSVAINGDVIAAGGGQPGAVFY
jgi:NAD(P)-dependent dehydrogenase (short-subunit alcohol dehydrogenase family)